ncbi:MAG: glycosyltransferase family 39 protein, partial [Planctomycetes bacterium]|nr:glycosyltransferase family 39 protein [Planctomycetota bacterium]
GYSEWSLRLFPLLCGVGSLFLFRRLAARLLSGWSYVLAVACLAVAKAPVGLSCDVKPYSCDLLVASGLLLLTVEWFHRPHETRWLRRLAVALPVGVFFSYPTLFVGAAISLAVCGTLLVRAVRAHRTSAGAGLITPEIRGNWSGLLAFHLSLAVAAAAVVWKISRPEAGLVRAFMDECWSSMGGFPPLTEPWKFVLWFVDVHFGEKIFAIPYAAENGGGLVCCGLCVLGAVILYRRGERGLVAVCLAMFGLTFAASVIHRYPYGGHIRLVQFLMPGVTLAVGAGAAAALECLRYPVGRRVACGALAVLVLFGGGRAVREVLRPWDYLPDHEHREFARRFWEDESHGLTVCAQADLRQNFSPGSWDTYYRCNQFIYSRRHHAGQLTTAQKVNELQQPFRLVVYRAPRDKFNTAALECCLNQFEGNFELVGRECYQMPLKDGWFDMYGCYEVYRFQPRQQFAQNE